MAHMSAWASLSGLRVIESEHAMAFPSAMPRTDDMRAMVDHLQALGQIRRRPAAFQMGDRMVVHPDIMRAFRHRLSQEIDAIAMKHLTAGMF